LEYKELPVFVFMRLSENFSFWESYLEFIAYLKYKNEPPRRRAAGIS
jgi:hypothetical protein